MYMIVRGKMCQNACRHGTWHARIWHSTCRHMPPLLMPAQASATCHSSHPRERHAEKTIAKSTLGFEQDPRPSRWR